MWSIERLRAIRNIPDMQERFRQSSILYCRYLAEEGVGVRPFSQPELPLFSALPGSEKLYVLGQIGSALEIFQQLHDEGQPLRDTPKLIWRALRKFGWVPQPDIFDKIEEADVICVYSKGQRQVFQNIRFFDYVSLTLEQLYSKSWNEYRRRDPFTEEQLKYHARELIAGRITCTLDPGIPEHLVEETGTEDLLKFMVRVRYISPLKTGNELVGALVINRCRFL